MRGKFLLMLVGATLGGISAYLFTKKDEELKNRIAVLQEKVKKTDLSNKVKSSLDEILSKLNKITTEKVASPSIDNVDRERVLREVEEKVEQLEELLRKEQ
ncbi:MAG: hypothetical protein DSY59_02945 [Persephonella sp.]|nr:MAG: hypothetical protein DSY60_06150 [Persephonella sp.]RUM60506.1 MAG: hypothetical protein DSY59_02945 [Persephonella sp.]